MNSLVGDPGGADRTASILPTFQCFRGSDFVQPAQTFVFLEEHPDTINDGFS